MIFYARAGADINAEDMEGNTPLTRALESPSIDMLKTLITPQNVLSKDSAGNTPLHIALIKDSPFDYIKFLVETGADVNARNKDGDSVLFLAVRKNKKDVGDLLLSKNADIFASNTENNSPLRIALTQGGEVQDWLITSQTLNASDGSGNSPLHYACEWKLDEAVSALIQKGANVNAVNANGESALFAAVKADSPSTINILVENGIITDPFKPYTRSSWKHSVALCCKMEQSSGCAVSNFSWIRCKLSKPFWKNSLERLLPFGQEADGSSSYTKRSKRKFYRRDWPFCSCRRNPERKRRNGKLIARKRSKSAYSGNERTQFVP